MQTHPNLLMRLLPIPTLLHDGHNDVLSSHERQLLRNPPRNNFGIYNQTLRNILQRAENDICSEERFGKGDATVGTVIKGAFEPLYARGHQRILVKDHLFQVMSAYTGGGLSLVDM